MNFYEYAAAFGILTDRLYPCDRIQRLPTQDKPHKRNAAVFFDGRRGWVWVWGASEQINWWAEGNAKPWTDDEKKEWGRRQQKARDERARNAFDAAQAARELIAVSAHATHPYLAHKGLPDAIGLVAPNGALLVPMNNAEGKPIGLQYISLVENQWQKMFLPGQRSSGAVHRIGRGVETILCEGYSTGLSIAEAAKRLRLSMSVMCCFSGHNIETVAPMVKGRPMVFADNDRPDRMGRQAGQAAAIATGLPWIMSDAEGQDANDLHQTGGIMAVCKKIMELRLK